MTSAELRKFSEDLYSRLLSPITAEGKFGMQTRTIAILRIEGAVRDLLDHAGQGPGLTPFDGKTPETAAHPIISIPGHPDYVLHEHYLALLTRFKTMSTVEMMCENYNVDAHVREWEARCLKAEERLATATQQAREMARLLQKSLHENWPYPEGRDDYKLAQAVLDWAGQGPGLTAYKP